MKPSTLLLPLFPLFAIAATGCTSQVDDIETPDLTSPAALPIGIFVGRTSFQSSPDTVVSTALIEPNGRIVVVGDQAEYLASGLYSTAGRGINAQVRFHVPNLRDEDGAPVAPASNADFIGTYTPQVDFTGTFVRSDGDAGSMNFVYDEQTEVRPDLRTLVGTWSNADAFGDASVSFTFVNGGGFSGLDAAGCRFTDAEAQIIESRYNLYRVRFSRTCIGEPAATLFTGLMTVVSRTVAGQTGNQMILTGSNSTAAVSFQLTEAR
ncbi:MAG: hypothetical protein C0434_13790 [Xanthomonadaceae bacterium]|nr:hypothetical protein [Xanthomonadaceae bacterium]